MTKKQERLDDLKCVIYNAEDSIDGCYDSKDIDYLDLTEINDRYDKLLEDMNKLVELLSKQFNNDK